MTETDETTDDTKAPPTGEGEDGAADAANKTGGAEDPTE